MGGRIPDAPAVVTEAGALSYRAINRRANRLAHFLRAAGVAPDVRVGICLERTDAMLAALLAVAKAGGCYLPLDASFPADRLRAMLEESRPRLVLTERSLMESLPDVAERVCLDDRATAALIERGAEANLPPVAGPDDAAYVLYTSGSTGRPKGVEVLRRGLNNTLHSFSRLLDFKQGDSFLAITTLTFDIAQLELLLPLVCGGRVIIAGSEVARDPRLLRRALDTCGASCFQATPTTWRMLLDSGWAGDTSLTGISGGEALDRTLADRLLDRVGTLWNAYGPTETALYSTACKITRGSLPPPIGRAVDNTLLYVLDEHRRPVPHGTPGELYIGGAGVASGYVQRPELTDERFLPNPFTQQLGARMYKTGDMIRSGPDGILEYLGRIDAQVKVRGFRIEPGEIEFQLLEQAGVRAAAVVAREDARGDKQLVAYVVPQSAASATPQGLRRALAAALPPYMVPAAFVLLDRMPTTPSGKVDRKALPAPTITFGAMPRHQMEARVAAAFAAALGVPAVGVADDFFELGGDSLKAVSLALGVEKEFGRSFTLSELATNPTVEALARLLREQPETGPRGPVPLRAGGPELAPLFCFPGQGGYSLGFRGLIRHLRPGRAVWGFDLPGLRYKDRPMGGMAEMAENALTQMRAVQPCGPYLLCGYSFGGLLAFEIARRMTRAGEAAPMLVLVDTWAPGFPRPLPLYRRVAWHTRKLMAAPLPQKVRYARDRSHNVINRVRRITFGLHPAARPGTGPPDLRSITDSMAQFNRAATVARLEYRPGRYNGNLILVRAEVMPQWEATSLDEPTNGWSKFVNGTTHIVPVACDHLQILEEPYLAQWSAEIDRLLNAGVPRTLARPAPGESPTIPGGSTEAGFARLSMQRRQCALLGRGG